MLPINDDEHLSILHSLFFKLGSIWIHKCVIVTYYGLFINSDLFDDPFILLKIFFKLNKLNIYDPIISHKINM